MVKNIDGLIKNILKRKISDFYLYLEINKKSLLLRKINFVLEIIIFFKKLKILHLKI